MAQRTSTSKKTANSVNTIQGANTNWKTSDKLGTSEWSERRDVAVKFFASLPASEQSAIQSYFSACIASGINRKIAIEGITENYKVTHPDTASKETGKKAVKSGEFVTADMLKANNDALMGAIAELLKKK